MNTANPLVENQLRSFLAEDLGYGDITTEALIDPAANAFCDITANESCVIAGLHEAQILLKLVNCEGTTKITDGQRVPAKTRVLQAKGPASSLLKAERVLLNLLSHMSGVATATAELVDLAKKSGGSKVRIACTRKTLPGLRYFEKRAVELGRGDTHRLRLDDAVLIKDNHLVFSGTIADSVTTARAKVSFTKKIEVEVVQPSQASEAARAGADIILLDNMSPELVKKTVELLEATKLRSRVTLEASGGITRDNLVRYARTGVDIISVGRITHSARSIDMSMEIRPTRTKAIRP